MRICSCYRLVFPSLSLSLYLFFDCIQKAASYKASVVMFRPGKGSYATTLRFQPLQRAPGNEQLSSLRLQMLCQTHPPCNYSFKGHRAESKGRKKSPPDGDSPHVKHTEQQATGKSSPTLCLL